MSLLLVVGLAAAGLTLLTYLLMTTGRASVKAYDAVNVVAAPPIVAQSAKSGAWPSVILSSSYMVVALVGLWQKRGRK